MMGNSPKELEKVVNEMQDSWTKQGKQWDINPPLASHFGGVWERAMGQVRQIIQGYLLPKQDRLLTGEEFRTMLQHASRIMNSTPLHEAPESPNDSQPITPQHLMTQRDDACLKKPSRPTNHKHADLLAYGAKRWKRIEALADEFAEYWKHYIYQIGTVKEKWTRPQRNAEVGDVVLLTEKGLSTSRLDWTTSTITSATKDQDNLVRRVMVQPQKKPGQKTSPEPKERAIHDLILLKAITAKDNGAPDSTTFADAPPEATVFKYSILADDPELVDNFPKKRPIHATKKEIAQRPSTCSIQRPIELIDPLPHNDATSLQASANARLNQIH